MNIQAIPIPKMISASTRTTSSLFAANGNGIGHGNGNGTKTKPSSTHPTMNKTITNKNAKYISNSSNETSIVHGNGNGSGDLYDRLDQISVSSDEFYANLLSMSDDSLELGSIDGDGEVFIQGTELITSSFFYTGHPTDKQQQRRRRGKKKKRTVAEFNKIAKTTSTTITATSDVSQGQRNSVDDTYNTIVPFETTQAVQEEKDLVVESKKYVRFLVDDDDNTIPELFIIDRIDDEYHCDVYYNDNEHEAMKIDSFFFAEDYMIDNIDNGMTLIAQLVDDAINCPYNTTGWYNHITTSTFQNIIYQWCNGTGRGLESFVIPTLYMTSTNTIKSVLLYQSKLQGTVGNNNKLTKSERRYLLAQESIRHTEGSNRLAHILAIGDQLVVQQQDQYNNQINNIHDYNTNDYFSNDNNELTQQQQKQQQVPTTIMNTTTTSSSILMNPSYWINKLNGSCGK